MWVSCLVLILCVVSHLTIISLSKESCLKNYCLHIFISVFLFVCVIVAVPLDAMGWSVRCGCGIS